MIGRFGQINQLVPVLAPVDTAATAIWTNPVRMRGIHRGTFGVQFGVITAASADQAVTVTLYAATSAATTGATAIAGKYRLSAAVGDTEAPGAITAFTSAGISIATTDDGKLLLIDVDPALMAAVSDGQYALVKITPDAGGTVTLVSAFFEGEPRYAQNSPLATHAT